VILDIDALPLTFGKFKGKTPTEISEIAPEYIVWAYETVKPPPCSEELYVAARTDLDEECVFSPYDVLD
jgi:hypothetical protein